MKKILILSLMTFLLTGIKSHAETIQTILLLHEGTGTSFAFDKLQDAVNAAVAGDTLYLNEGNYPLAGDTLTIDKDLSIIGIGNKTRLIGCINVAVPDSITLQHRLLDALLLSQNLIVSRPVNGLKFRKVQFEDALVWNATTRDVLVDRCYVTTFYTTKYLKSANVVNCKISKEAWSANETDNKSNIVTFFNCSIGLIEGYDADPNCCANDFSTYVNCIIAGYVIHYWVPWTAVPEFFANSTFKNCLLHSTSRFGYGNNLDHCYDAESDDETIFDWTYNNGTVLTNEQLIAKGYIGTDGTAVGCGGGQAPYALIPSGISVEESQLGIDWEKRTLNVTLKLHAQ